MTDKQTAMDMHAEWQKVTAEVERLRAIVDQSVCATCHTKDAWYCSKRVAPGRRFVLEGRTLMADLYRAVGVYVESDGRRVEMGLGGLRHERAMAERDMATATRGFVEAWVEEATWARVDASADKDGPGA